MKIKLYRLRVLAGQCEVLSSQRALGFITEMKIGKLGKLAYKAVEYYSDKLNSIVDEKRKIAIDLREKNADKPEEVISAMIWNDPKFVEQNNIELEFWNTEEPDFEFDTIEMTLKDDYIFKDQTKEVNPFGVVYTVDPYVALQNLIEEGFIKLSE